MSVFTILSMAAAASYKRMNRLVQVMFTILNVTLIRYLNLVIVI